MTHEMTNHIPPAANRTAAVAAAAEHGDGTYHYKLWYTSHDASGALLSAAPASPNLGLATQYSKALTGESQVRRGGEVEGVGDDATNQVPRTNDMQGAAPPVISLWGVVHPSARAQDKRYVGNIECR
jgi:hypothetical protein